MLIFNFYLISLGCSLIAFVYSQILTEPEHIFNGLYKRLEFLPQWLFKPLIGCSLCVTGQLALWVFCINLLFDYSHFISILHFLKIVFTHVYFVSLSIFITWILNKI